MTLIYTINLKKSLEILSVFFFKAKARRCAHHGRFTPNNTRNLLKILHDRFACLCLLVHSFRVVRARVYVPLENSFSFVFWGFYEYLENTQNVTSTEWTNVQTWCMIFACLSVIWMTSKTPNFSIA